MKRFICELPNDIQDEIVRRYQDHLERNCIDCDAENIRNEKIVDVWYSANCDDVILGRAFPMDDLVPWGTFC